MMAGLRPAEEVQSRGGGDNGSGSDIKNPPRKDAAGEGPELEDDSNTHALRISRLGRRGLPQAVTLDRFRRAGPMTELVGTRGPG